MLFENYEFISLLVQDKTVVGNLMFSSDNLLDFYAMVVSVVTVGIVKVLEISWNMK